MLNAKGKPHMSLLEYYRQRLIDLATEQRKLYPFAFGLIDAPSDRVAEDSYLNYWDLEESIQKCRNEILTLKGI